jgi:hypothetical protein
VHSVGCLYIMFLINAREMEHVKINVTDLHLVNQYLDRHSVWLLILVCSHQWTSYLNVVSDKNLTPLFYGSHFLFSALMVFVGINVSFCTFIYDQSCFTNGAHGGVTSRKVAGSIPDYVIGIFHLHNPSGRTMALGLNQPLTEMSTRNISWG